MLVLHSEPLVVKYEMEQVAFSQQKIGKRQINKVVQKMGQK